MPANNPEYPSKSQLVLRLMAQFRKSQSQVSVKAIAADVLHGQADLMDAVSGLFGGVQAISQLRHNQNIQVRNRTQSLSQYFVGHPGVEQKLSIRGQEPIIATVGSLRVK